MPSSAPDATARAEWTLIRNARQLLTLQGPSGARRGSDMANPGLISGGSILIRNGIIYEIGPSRRVENLAGARRAKEVDAGGQIVLPAFVDAATSLFFPRNKPGETLRREPFRTESAAIRIMSKKAALGNAHAAALALARHGCLTVGARTPSLDSPQMALRTMGKALRVHQALQGRPLHIRSVVAPRLAARVESTSRTRAPEAVATDALTGKWLPFVRSHKLATILELDVGDFGVEAAAFAARAAAGLGFAIRLRSEEAPTEAALSLAVDSAAISLLAPCEDDGAGAAASALVSAGCVRIYPAREVFSSAAGGFSRAIAAGAAIAFASDSQPGDAPPGSLLAVAIAAVQRLGLSIEEALTAVIWNPAAALRMTGVAGSIEAGKPADLVSLPVDDYRQIATLSAAPEIGFVLRGGKLL